MIDAESLKFYVQATAEGRQEWERAARYLKCIAQMVESGSMHEEVALDIARRTLGQLALLALELLPKVSMKPESEVYFEDRWLL